jgi:hypothetical protein
MNRIFILGVTGVLFVLHAPAQVNVGGGAGPIGAGGATSSFLHGTAAPSASDGADGDFYLNISSTCLYGPKVVGAWPSTCVSLVGPQGPSGTTLSYTAENVSNKGAAGGYAPLNSSSQVPLANLPVIPYSQTSGVQSSLAFTPLSPGNNLADLSDTAAARSNLGLIIGTNVQQHSAMLDGIAVLTADGMVVLSGGSASSGSLTGDISTNGLTATVNSVGGSSAANIHNAEMLANAATANSVSSTLVRRDSQGNINVTQVYTGGTAVENTGNKGAPNGYAPLNASSQLPLTNLPAIPYSQTSGVQPALGFTPENTASKAQPNGYASLDTNGLVPVTQLPYTTLPSVATAGDVNPAGNLNATGNVNAGIGSTAAGCVHLSDANAVHDMGVCAPASGFNGMFTLPPVAGTTGQVLALNTSGGTSWLSTLRGTSATPTLVAGAAAGTSPATSVIGTNNSGKFTITIGSSPAGSGAALATIQFAGTALAPGACVIGPANGTTAALGAAYVNYVSAVSATGFTVSTGNSALTAGSTYSWWYVCI